MKKTILFCVFINVMIFGVFSYFIFIKSNDNDVTKMIDLVGYNKNDVEELIDYYEVEYIYFDSNEKKDTIIYTEPSKNELTQIGQKVKVYISSGTIKEYYLNLINTYYEDNIDYINELEIKIDNLIIESQISDDYPDGIIIYQSLDGIINEDDTLIIKVNYNKPLINVPNLIGKSELEVIYFLKDYDLKYKIIYTKMDGTNKVYNQSISPNTLVISDTYLYIYIAT